MSLADKCIVIGCFVCGDYDKILMEMGGKFSDNIRVTERQNRSTEGCSKLKRSVDMTSSGKNGLNIRTNASPKWDRTRCPEE